MSERPSGNGRHFFKILLGDFSQRLRIPPALVKHIVMDAYKKATLTGPSGRHWRVQLSKWADNTYLQDGWPEFVKDHSLNDSDFLVFRYDGKRNFTVRIFDKTACEREEVSTCNARQGTALCSAKRTRQSLKKTSDSGHQSQHDLFGSGANNQQSDHMHSRQASQCNNIDSTERKHMPTSEINCPKKIRIEDYDAPVSKSSRKICKREPLTKEKEKALENAQSFSKDLRFPSCSVVMNRSCLYKAFSMGFPCQFTRAHLPRRKRRISLFDPKGREYDVIFIPYPSGKGSLSGGWSAFACANELEVGDVCIFEVLSESQIQVHFFLHKSKLLNKRKILKSE